MKHVITIYLALNTIMYLALGLWCAIAPEYTATAVGLSYVGMKGYAEYVAAYGGMEFGIGVFYLLTLLKPALRDVGILFSLCLYLGLASFRSSALIFNGSDIANGWNFYGAEITFALGAVLISLFKNSSSIPS